jgi:hypothetical protein
MNPVVEKLWNQAAQESDGWEAQVVFVETLVKLTVFETISAADHIESIKNIFKHFGIEHEQPLV